MLKNFILIALRTMRRSPVYSAINIAGLSIGIACSILILLWVADEVSFDRFHEDYRSLYKVHMNRDFSGTIQTQLTLPIPIKEAIHSKSGRIEHVSLTNFGEGNLLAVGEKNISKVGLAVTEEFLKMFSFKMLDGNPENALSDPSSIVLTASSAKALFGEADPLNQLVKIENDRDLKVTGIIEDVPQNSTFQFDYLLPFAYYEATQAWVRNSVNDWNNNSFHVYVSLQPGADAREVDNAIRDLVSDNNPKAGATEVFLHPMSKWRLYSNFENGEVSGGRIENVRMFGGIGVFILIVACINFMNLATARSESRAREVGIRKSVGSGRRQLIAQFVGESLLVALVAFMFALLLVELVLPSYNNLVGKSLAVDYGNPGLWIGAAVLVILTGLVSGSYPAFYLSSFRPAKVLKGKVQAGKGSTIPRKILVTLQFAFSIFLIMGTLVVYEQIQYTKAREIGYDRENLLLIWTNSELEKNFASLRRELSNTGAVKSVAKSSAPITRIFSSTTGISWPGKVDEEKVSFTTFGTEYDFTETMGIRVLEGRDFSRDFKSDSAAVVVNQAAVDLMGMEDPVGQTVTWDGLERTIIGVMENVVMGSPYHPVDPLAVVFAPEWSSTISVRLQETSDLPGAIDKVQAAFKAIDPEHPLWYRFADAEFETKFTAINMISKLSGIFAFMAIFISCLGLFGLAAFTAEQRTKEVGIRKVLGASVTNLVLLISGDFSRLVLLAFALSAPLAWWVLNDFLEQYPYRIGIPWWIFVLAGSASLFIAVAIVSTQAFRAARNNPVNSLRSE